MGFRSQAGEPRQLRRLPQRHVAADRAAPALGGRVPPCIEDWGGIATRRLWVTHRPRPGRAHQRGSPAQRVMRLLRVYGGRLAGGLAGEQPHLSTAAARGGPHRLPRHGRDPRQLTTRFPAGTRGVAGAGARGSLPGERAPAAPPARPPARRPAAPERGPGVAWTCRVSFGVVSATMDSGTRWSHRLSVVASGPLLLRGRYAVTADMIAKRRCSPNLLISSSGTPNSSAARRNSP